MAQTTPAAPTQKTPGGGSQGANTSGEDDAGGADDSGGNSGGAGASPDVMTEADPAVVLELAKGYGTASMDKDNGGDPMIAGRLQGLKYVIYFYGCQEKKHCRSIQFSSGYTDAFTTDKANEWNTKYRWIKVYAQEGSNFKMDCDFYGGVTKAWLDAQFATWDSLVADIKEFTK